MTSYDPIDVWKHVMYNVEYVRSRRYTVKYVWFECRYALISQILFILKINQMDKNYIVGWQADLVNTKESLRPVCHKLYHMVKENLAHLK